MNTAIARWYTEIVAGFIEKGANAMIMKKFHRALALFLPVLLLCLHTVPAQAAETEIMPTGAITQSALEGDYSRLHTQNDLALYALAVAQENAVSLLSLDEETLDRSWNTSASVNYGGWFASETLAAGVKNFSWQGNGFYRLASYSGSDKSECWCRIYMDANAYQDWIVNATLAYEDGASLRMNGFVKYTMQCGWFNQNAFVSTSSVQYISDTCVAVPDRLGIMVNGDVVQTLEVGADGSVDLAFEYPMAGNVNSLGYRWYFDEEEHLLQQDVDVSGVQTRGLYAEVVDNAVVSVYVQDPVVTKIDEVKKAVVALPSTIYNFFFGEEGDSASSAFKSSVDSAISSGEAVRDEIANMDTPDPDTLVPDIQQYAPLDEYTAYTGTFGALMENDYVVKLMMVALGFAFVGYVFFGKRA